jgi:2-oxoglutarate ferredoxin oxidoreductase subunit gamma
VSSADAVVALSQEAFTRYGQAVKSGATLIIDPDMVFSYESAQQIHLVPATKIAEELGNSIVANIVMLGALTQLTRVVSPEAILSATLESVPSRFQELNRRALAAGMEAAAGSIG